MVGTHADSLLAEAVLKGFGAGSAEENGIQTTFTTDELTTMWKAAWKDASVPPVGDSNVVYSDREEVRIYKSLSQCLYDEFLQISVIVHRTLTTKYARDFRRSLNNTPRAMVGLRTIFIRRVLAGRWIMLVRLIDSFSIKLLTASR